MGATFQTADHFVQREEQTSMMFYAFQGMPKK